MHQARLQLGTWFQRFIVSLADPQLRSFVVHVEMSTQHVASARDQQYDTAQSSQHADCCVHRCGLGQ